MAVKDSYSLHSLKLFLEGLYEVSDRDLNSLSDILVESRMERHVENGSIFRLKHILDKYGMGFPCSLNLMRELWGKETTTDNFNESIRLMVSDGLLSVCNLTGNAFFGRIKHLSENDIPGERISFGVLYSRDRLEDVLEVMDEVMEYTGKQLFNSIKEGSIYLSLPNQFKNFVSDIRNGVREQHPLRMELEEHRYDDVLKLSEISLVFRDVGNNKFFSGWDNRFVVSALGEAFKSYRGNYLKALEGYVDGLNALYLFVAVDSRASADQLYDLSNYVGLVINELRDVMERKED